MSTNLQVRRWYGVFGAYIGLSQCEVGDNPFGGQPWPTKYIVPETLESGRPLIYITGIKSPLATRHQSWASKALDSDRWLFFWLPFPHFGFRTSASFHLPNLEGVPYFLGGFSMGGGISISGGAIFLWDHIACDTESEARCLPSLEESQECRLSEGWPSFYLLWAGKDYWQHWVRTHFRTVS